MNIFGRLFVDETGSVLSAEAVMLASVGVLGVVAGVGSLTSAVNSELNEVGSAFRSMDQSYRTNGYQVSYSGGSLGRGYGATGGTTVMTRGSQYVGHDPQTAVNDLQLQFVEDTGAVAQIIGRHSATINQIESGVSQARQFEADTVNRHLLEDLARMRLEIDALKAGKFENRSQSAPTEAGAF